MKSLFLRIIVIFLVIVGVTFYLLRFFIGNSGQTKAAGVTVTGILDLTPGANTLTVGQEKTISLKIKPSAAMFIRGYRVIIDFDKTKVEIKDISYKLGIKSGGLGQDNAHLAAINNRGRIKIVGEVRTINGASLSSTAATEIVTIKIKGKAAGGSNLFIKKNWLNLFRINNTSKIINRVYGSDNEVLAINGGGPSVTPGNNPSVTPTPDPNAPTPTPDPNSPNPTVDPNAPVVKLLLKLKFQGISIKPATAALNELYAKVKLKGETTEQSTAEKSVKFTADDSGIWTGSVDFNVDLRDTKFSVYIKGPHHIKKKICVAVPTETAGGTYRCSSGQITLIPSTTAVTTLNFSGITLLAGDLPVQDGTVSAYDTSLVRGNLSKTDADAVVASDVNRDGKVDTQDYSLIIAALSIKNDEE